MARSARNRWGLRDRKCLHCISSDSFHPLQAVDFLCLCHHLHQQAVRLDIVQRVSSALSECLFFFLRKVQYHSLCREMEKSICVKMSAKSIAEVSAELMTELATHVELLESLKPGIGGVSLKKLTENGLKVLIMCSVLYSTTKFGTGNLQNADLARRKLRLKAKDPLPESNTFAWTFAVVVPSGYLGTDEDTDLAILWRNLCRTRWGGEGDVSTDPEDWR